MRSGLIDDLRQEYAKTIERDGYVKLEENIYQCTDCGFVFEKTTDNTSCPYCKENNAIPCRIVIWQESEIDGLRTDVWNCGVR